MNKVIEKILSVSSRRKVLEELIKKREATAYEIAKELGIPDAAAGRHLFILCEVGLTEAPTISTSGGRLKKIYKPTRAAEGILREFWDKEIQSAPESIKRMYPNRGNIKNKKE